MNWVTLIPLIAQVLSAIQPVLSGASRQNVASAGNNLIPILQNLMNLIAPASQPKVAPAVSAVTMSFDQNPVKWVQQVLNLAGNSLIVDGVLGPQTLAAADAFAEGELGLVPGGLASTILRSTLQSVAAKANP